MIKEEADMVLWACHVCEQVLTSQEEMATHPCLSIKKETNGMEGHDQEDFNNGTRSSSRLEKKNVIKRPISIAPASPAKSEKKSDKKVRKTPAANSRTNKKMVLDSEDNVEVSTPIVRNRKRKIQDSPAVDIINPPSPALDIINTPTPALDIINPPTPALDIINTPTPAVDILSTRTSASKADKKTIASAIKVDLSIVKTEVAEPEIKSESTPGRYGTRGKKLNLPFIEEMKRKEEMKKHAAKVRKEVISHEKDKVRKEVRSHEKDKVRKEVISHEEDNVRKEVISHEKNKVRKEVISHEENNVRKEGISHEKDKHAKPQSEKRKKSHKKKKTYEELTETITDIVTENDEILSATATTPEPLGKKRRRIPKKNFDDIDPPCDDETKNDLQALLNEAGVSPEEDNGEEMDLEEVSVDQMFSLETVTKLVEDNAIKAKARGRGRPKNKDKYTDTLKMRKNVQGMKKPDELNCPASREDLDIMIVNMTDFDEDAFRMIKKSLDDDDDNKPEVTSTCDIRTDVLKMGYAMMVQDAIDRGDISLDYEKYRYKCCLCDIVFREVQNLFVHFQDHINNFHCRECGLSFKKRDALSAHNCICKPDMPEWLKLSHAQRIDEALMRLEISIEHQEKCYQCLICSKDHTELKTLLSHLKSHKSVFNCEKCGRVFSKQAKLSGHICAEEKDRIRWHSMGPTEQITDAVSCGDMIYQPEFNIYFCNCCFKSFLDIHCLRRHVSVHRGVHSCGECGRSFNRKDNLDEHSCGVTAKSYVPYRCKICGRGFKESRDVDLHLRLHPSSTRCSTCLRHFVDEESCARHECDPKLHYCPICLKGFNNKSVYKKHQKQHPSYFACETCKKMYATRKELILHVCPDGTGGTAGTNKCFTCEICGLAFANEKMCNGHRTRHTDRHMCSICGKRFTRKESLACHILDQHPDSDETLGIYMCMLCTTPLLNRQELHEHLKTHEHQMTCKKCNETFATNYELLLHTGVCSQTQDNQKNMCGFCNTAFLSPIHLSRHLLVHREKSNLDCVPCNVSLPRPALVKHLLHCTGDDRIDLECFICETVFTDLEEYRGHYLDHLHPRKCTICWKIFLLRAHMDSHKCVSLNNVGITCEVCNKVFKNTKLLHVHMVKHKEPSLSCDKCGKTFLRRQNQHDHVCVDDAGEEVRIKWCSLPIGTGTNDASARMKLKQDPDHLTCSLCDKTFTTKTNLKKHVLSHGAKTEECPKCGKFFHHKYYLREHIKHTHSVGKKSICPHCGKLLKNHFSLNAHMRHFHSGIEDTFTCDVCARVFRQRGNLMKHKLVHSTEKTFKCNLCTEAFKFPEQLRLHTLWHRHGYRFQCELCNKQFVQGFQLSGHMKQAHSGKIFICIFCGTICRHKSGMCRHLKRAHPQRTDWKANPKAFLESLAKDAGEWVEKAHKTTKRNIQQKSIKQDKTPESQVVHINNDPALMELVNASEEDLAHVNAGVKYQYVSAEKLEQDNMQPKVKTVQVEQADMDSTTDLVMSDEQHPDSYLVANVEVPSSDGSAGPVRTIIIEASPGQLMNNNTLKPEIAEALLRLSEQGNLLSDDAGPSTVVLQTEDDMGNTYATQEIMMGGSDAGHHPGFVSHVDENGHMHVIMPDESTPEQVIVSDGEGGNTYQVLNHNYVVQQPQEGMQTMQQTEEGTIVMEHTADSMQAIQETAEGMQATAESMHMMQEMQQNMEVVESMEQSLQIVEEGIEEMEGEQQGIEGVMQERIKDEDDVKPSIEVVHVEDLVRKNELLEEGDDL